MTAAGSGRRIVSAALLCWALCGWHAPRAAAQEPSPWSATYAAERGLASFGGNEVDWNTDQVLVTWAKPSVAGWQGSIDRYQRSDMVDFAASTQGYKQIGAWTLEGGVSASNAADFIYRLRAAAAVSRLITGRLVATGGYRYLTYSTADLHQWQPELTWYPRRGELGARLYVTRNATGNVTTGTVLVRALCDVTSRVRMTAGAAFGSRIFDVAPPGSSADAGQTFGLVRLGVTSHDYVEAGLTAARERPDFSYRSVVLTYRRVF
jgi:YaiO family outer membrane protein